MDRVRVKRLREALGHTQVEFAEHFPVSVKTVSRWELGEVAPSPMARARMQELSRKHRGDTATESEPTAESESESASTMPRRRGIIPSTD